MEYLTYIIDIHVRFLHFFFFSFFFIIISFFFFFCSFLLPKYSPSRFISSVIDDPFLPIARWRLKHNYRNSDNKSWGAELSAQFVALLIDFVYGEFAPLIPDLKMEKSPDKNLSATLWRPLAVRFHLIGDSCRNQLDISTWKKKLFWHYAQSIPLAEIRKINWFWKFIFFWTQLDELMRKNVKMAFKKSYFDTRLNRLLFSRFEKWAHSEN